MNKAETYISNLKEGMGNSEYFDEKEAKIHFEAGIKSNTLTEQEIFDAVELYSKRLKAKGFRTDIIGHEDSFEEGIKFAIRRLQEVKNKERR